MLPSKSRFLHLLHRAGHQDSGGRERICWHIREREDEANGKDLWIGKWELGCQCDSGAMASKERFES